MTYKLTETVDDITFNVTVHKSLHFSLNFKNCKPFAMLFRQRPIFYNRHRKIECEVCIGPLKQIIPQDATYHILFNRATCNIPTSRLNVK